MSTLDTLGKVISTDVLIVGGGIGGLAAGIAAREASPKADVLIAEKATTGWAGKASKGGGILTFLTPENKLEDFLQFHAQYVGRYLADQELLTEFMQASPQVIERFSSWGVPLARNADGSLKYVRRHSLQIPWGSLCCLDLDMCVKMRTRARRLGVKMIDKVAIVDLLKDGDRVVGAIGFDIVDGACYIIKAKATILANGSQDFRVMYMWSSGRGDGIAAAYRAGAEMRNAEFCNFVNFIYKANGQVAVRAEDFLVNAKGDSVTAKYRPHIELESDISVGIMLGWYKEILAGNGPVYYEDPYNPNRKTDVMNWDVLVGPRPNAAAFYGRAREKGKVVINDPSRVEVVPGLIGEQSPVKVDHGMATTLPGLYAIGDVCYNGSCAPGASPAPPGGMRGTGLMFALFGGMKVAPRAVEYAAGQGTANVDYRQAQALKEGMLAPLKRESGVTALEIVHAIQELVVPIKYNGYKSEQRMREALGKVLELKARLPELAAKDTHYLAACNEVRSMVLGAEMLYRASLVRKESRGWFVREDYPEMDNKNWLKWIAIKDQNGEMTIATENVPIERYPVKPGETSAISS